MRKRCGGTCALLALLAACSKPPTPPARQTKVEAPPAENRLLFTGDVMLTREVGRRILEKHDPALPFRAIAPFLSAADLTFVNLESPFSDKGKRTQHGLIFNADPANIAGLLLAGVDVASTANNHTRDCGPAGVEYTYNWLKQNGIQPVGSTLSPEETHQGIVVSRKGVRFGFLAYTYDQKNGNWRDIDPRIAAVDIPTMQRDVASLRQRCDVVIVSMHNGIEYIKHPNQSQVAFAHASIDAGAALVVGHHPHVTQPAEAYHGGVIFYSLGNFVFDQFQRQETQWGDIAEAVFLGKTLHSWRLFPVHILADGPVLASRPVPAPQDRPHEKSLRKPPEALATGGDSSPTSTSTTGPN